ncbi:LysR family transcriptional regulator [Burkholderia diffusa]|uniref:LysR family transcriptional regulator n=1 Tax=Burkholderia diffusa TaxID=488732 RepID=UPI0007525FE8|nr:LysR family transcriptional regulator [Burkholderia diffusa]KVN05969.1 LysR family transcriptional regulator [Burkholderia diffusa]
MDLLAAMRVFVRVVERGSMSAAARDLGMGQPAVSERIERLERELGVRLLLRNTRVTTCTDQGSVFYSRSKAVLEAADEARASVIQNEESVRGVLSIAAPQGLGELVLPGILARLRVRHPQLRVDLILNDRLVDPVTEGVDISLRLGAPGEGNFVAQRLGHLQRVLVASPAYLRECGHIGALQDLTRHPFIHVKGLFGDGQLQLVDAQQKQFVVPITPSMSASHWRPVYEWLISGAGIGVLQAPACADALANRTLVRVLPGYSVPGFELHALFPAQRPIPPKTRAALALLKEHITPMLNGQQPKDEHQASAIS